ncbi:MAG TPA: hypothetical protein VEV13_08110, partial [Candidatus Limnocylindria bacterium]|nr:hypothetical protein [Candidatus Limnocylindria bacterium]
LDFTQVWPGRDLVVLDADTARPSKTYRIVSVDTAAGNVTLDATPRLGGVTTTPWRLRPRPVLVAVDPFGGRLSGEAAEVTTTGLQAVVRLDASQEDLNKVNAHGFETIAFTADRRAHLPPRTYQIVHANPGTRSVTVRGNPDFVGGRSAWTLPAGVGGRLPALEYSLGRDATRGWDHYDAVLFAVLDGEVADRFRFTTYTSHKGDPATEMQKRSSVRGNARYVIGSVRSPERASRNFSFSIMDEEGLLRTPASWLLDYDYDGVRDARFYFEPVVTGDTAPAGTPPGTAGKGLLRIHYGNKRRNTGSGSEGCVVSPAYFALRARLVEHYQQERGALLGSGAVDADAARIAARLDLAGHGGDASGFWASTPAGHWDSKITGFLWIIRPDERPLG